MTGLAIQSTVDAGERVALFDVLRGFALFGILLYNIEAFAGLPFLSAADRDFIDFGGYDQRVDYFVRALIEAKFYSLFSFLFGLGFAVFMRRAMARAADAPRLFRRRLLGLLLIGLAHGFLLWFGDILHVYALFGFVLLAMRGFTDRALLRAALVLLIAPVAIYLVLLAVHMPNPFAPPANPPPDGGVFTWLRDALATGSYGDVLAANAFMVAAGWARRAVNLSLPRILGMFLLGYYVGRMRWLEDVRACRGVLHRWLALGFLVGLPLNLAYARLGQEGVALPASAWGLVQASAGSVGIPLLCLGYIAAIAIAFDSPWGRNILGALAPVGRMALTNYLLQSVVCVTLFYGLGFGLFGQVGRAIALAIALGLFIAQLICSALWFVWFKQGPVEHLWRRFTYGAPPRPAPTPHGALTMAAAIQGHPAWTSSHSAIPIIRWIRSFWSAGRSRR
jgi:uncharacterized protein